MDYEVWSQVLLELALAASGEQELKLLFKKSTSVFLRKLDCIHVAVLQNIENKLEPVYSMPKPTAKDDFFKEILEKLNKEDFVNDKKTHIFEGKTIYYAYRLEGFGMILIGRGCSLEEALVNDLIPITDVLAKSFCASLETMKRKETEAKLKRKIEAQNLLVSLATGFINTSLDEMDDAISNALSLVGSFTNSDRAYLFEYDFENNLMSNTFEWCGENIRAHIDSLQNISCDVFTKDWVDKHKKGEMLTIPDVEKLNKESSIYKILKEQQIKSLITIPLFLKGECLGFVGFDSVYDKKRWKDDDTVLLKILAELFTNVYLKKEHENRLVQARKLAESANTAKSEFLANMSHEIRTPLNGVVGMLNVLNDTKLTNEQMGYLKMADESIESLLSVINDILDYSKIEAGMMDLMEEVIDLEQEVQKVLRMLSIKANEKGLELGISLSRFIPRYVIADKMRIRQILLNLVNNAIKFTEKGFVCIKVECKCVKNGVANFLFEVIDSGVGINEDKLEHIFDQFTQIDGSSSRRYGGTGLGLAICKKMVGLMGGSLKVKSKVQKGTVFYFDLKLRVSNEGVENHEREVELRGKKALIVDDNSINRNVLEETFSYWGIIYDVAEDGFDALKKIEKAFLDSNGYDFALVDYAMPGMDGLELGEKIRLNKSWNKMVLIMITSSVSGQLPTDVLNKSGFVQMITKPIARTELNKSISKSLFKHKEGFDAYVKITKDDDENEKKNSEEKLFGVKIKEKLNVLIVDDNKANRMVAISILEKIGCRVTQAEDGLSATEKIEKFKYDVVFMDCQMPGIDGYEATQIIRKKGREFEEIPIVALTANAMLGDREKCIQAGMTDYVSKPFKRKDLEDVLARVLK